MVIELSNDIYYLIVISPLSHTIIFQEFLCLVSWRVNAYVSILHTYYTHLGHVCYAVIRSHDRMVILV